MARGVLSSPVVHIAELTPPEQRVLGCLIEKRWTTPDQYPLSLNALRLASNQSTNRDPVTDYDEHTVREAAQRLCRYGLARLASGQGSRTVKYRHLAEEGLGLGREELAVLCVLLLRGAQTPGELKSRSERMAHLGSLDDVERILDTLSQRGYARPLDRRPGQKEDRFEQRLGSRPELGDPAPTTAPQATRFDPASVAAPGSGPMAAPGSAAMAAPGSARMESARSAPAAPPERSPAAGPGTASDPAAGLTGLADRVAALEAQVAALRSELAALHDRAAVS